ncbi:hypothetical protein [Bradyrhizobium sp. G127]|jgi:hypothetical protein|uniref:hypothetical protein n=1 Tax=Bradyrhizobium sp. G127 TaxID=2904800 RepID=UPI001F3D8005|nr:hypothetical protein [Bradyrhizobium sp. G127]MCF2524938.1 hypothetical protein [Bradyrhizobium sp. G127]
MTLSPSVALIVDILVNAGFKCLPRPFKVGSIPFEFAAMLVGTDRSPDLIVIIDTVTEKEERARQKIGGLGRALDAVQSRRPVTAIITGPTPGDQTLESISKVCRVLPVGTPTGPSDDNLLRDWLAVLLPLQVPDTSAVAADPLVNLRNQTDELGVLILGTAPRGARAVQDALRQRLETPLTATMSAMSDSSGDLI